MYVLFAVCPRVTDPCVPTKAPQEPSCTIKKWTNLSTGAVLVLANLVPIQA